MTPINPDQSAGNRNKSNLKLYLTIIALEQLDKLEKVLEEGRLTPDKLTLIHNLIQGKSNN